MKNAGWKFLLLRNGKIVSHFDNSPWTIGKWREVPAPTEECRGLNCSETIEQAYCYVKGDILARVEYKGHVIRGGDKLTCQRMRIKKAWHFPAPAWAAFQQAKTTSWAAYQQAAVISQAAYEQAKATAWARILRTLKPIGAGGRVA